MREAVEKLWPELSWIRSEELREQVLQCWSKALELSPLTPDDLNEIPFTLLVPDCPATFMEHKRHLRHPFTGVHLAMSCGLPDEVSHIVATHAGEGNMVKRSTEAFIVHHADFMSFEPFKNLKR